MDPARAKELQDDEQREESPETAIRTMIEGELIDVHTSMPGIVKSFDAKTQTATVQPAIRRFFIGRGYVDLPQCVDVPVSFPRYGNFVITGPVSPGDEGELRFSERCIDNWWTTGGVQDPAEPRMHDLSDASFTPGISSKGRVPANIASDALEIRTLNGQTVIRLEAGAVILGSTTGAEPAVKGDVLDAILRTIAAHTHPETGATTLVSPTLATLPDPRSTKVKVG
jgi:hypothetical protein